MDNGPVQHLVGLGGWEHEVLDTCFYPRPGMSPTEKLAYYARFFQTTEVRPTFWDDSLTADDAEQWADAVHESGTFLFSVKLHALFTHRKLFQPQAARTVRGILQTLDRRNRLGALLMQFPYAFTNISGNRYHVSRLAEIFSGFPVYVELRHESWHHPSTTNFLQEHALHPVSADLPRVRQYMPFGTTVLGDTAYLRLHGRNEKGWLLNGMDTRYDYLYNTREMLELRRRLDLLSSRCRRALIVCNNTTGGKAVVNALQLLQSLRGTRQILVPSAAYHAFLPVREFGLPYEAECPLFGTGGRKAAV